MNQLKAMGKVLAALKLSQYSKEEAINLIISLYYGGQTDLDVVNKMAKEIWNEAAPTPRDLP